MKSLFQKYSLLSCFTMFSFAAIAQVSPTVPAPRDSVVLSDEIEVIRPYKPVLADAVKIRRNPDMNTDKHFMPVLTYFVTDKKLELNSNIKELDAQKVLNERPADLQNNYAKIGAGSMGTNLGELYFNTGKDQAIQAGAYVKHIGQSGDLDRQKFSRQEFGVFGRKINESYSLDGGLRMDRLSTYFYGDDPLTFDIPEMPKQRMSNISADAVFSSNYSENSTFNYTAKFNAYHFSNIGDGRESSFEVGGNLNKQIGTFYAGLNASADLTSVKDEAYSIGNNFLRANPYFQFKGSGFSVTIGANIVQNFGETSSLNIFPAVLAELPLSSTSNILFAGVGGDVLKTSLRDMSFENRFLNDNSAIENTIERLNIYAGVKGNAGAGLGYKVLAFRKTVDNLMLFVNNSTTINRFDVVYDQGESTLTGIEGEVNLKAADFLDLTGKVHLTDYKLITNERAWFRPGLRLSSNARARINNKFYLDAEAFVQGATYGRMDDGAGNFSAQQVKGFVDLSAGAEYRISPKIGVYVRANNLIGQSYQRYLYYSNLGTSVFGGINYGF